MYSMISFILSQFVYGKFKDTAQVIWETPVVVRNPQVQRMLTMIVGAIMGYCIEHNIVYNEMRPTEWRKYSKKRDEKLPRKREDLKKWSVSRVKELYGIDVSDDESDSILLGYAYVNKYGKLEEADNV